MNHARERHTAESAKRTAAAILDRMRSLGVEMKLGQAYEAAAAAAGYRNWATMKSEIEGAPASARPETTAAASLTEALQLASRTAGLPQEHARTLQSAANGDKDAVMQLAAHCGYVPVVFIDLEAEADRIRGLLEKSSGKELSSETLRGFALEFATGRTEDDRMYSDFFDDWLWETYSADDLAAGPPVR